MILKNLSEKLFKSSSNFFKEKNKKKAILNKAIELLNLGDEEIRKTINLE